MITEKQYKNLDDAYQYFNKKLFENKLPDSIITLNAKGKTAGYHHFQKYSIKENKQKISEIAFNPVTFEDQEDIEILQTLCHEMVHLWQHVFGNPPRRGYHDREWGSKMKEIGLYPSSTGEVGGKEVGQSMSDYIIEGGEFEKVAKAFLLSGNKIMVSTTPEAKKDRKKNKTREKFTCPSCFQAAWAKKTAKIMCGECEEHMVIEDKEDE